MTPEEPAVLADELASLEAQIEKRTQFRFYSIFPDNGPYRREHYPKHLAWMAAGKDHRVPPTRR